jgi:hypothetical protein
MVMVSAFMHHGRCPLVVSVWLFTDSTVSIELLSLGNGPLERVVSRRAGSRARRIIEAEQKSPTTVGYGIRNFVLFVTSRK